MPTRASLVCAGATFPAFASAAIASSVRIATSNVSAFSIRSRSVAAVLNSIDSVLPLAFSSCGFNASTAALTPLDANTRMPAACSDDAPSRIATHDAVTRLTIRLPLDARVLDADRQQVVQHGLEETRRRRLALLLRHLTVPFRDAGTTDIDDARVEIRDNLANEGGVDTSLPHERTEDGDVRLPRQRVHDPQPLRMCALELGQRVA